MREVAEFFGWISLLGYSISVLNFFMKYINKKYINKLSKENKKYIDMYRLIMKYVVRYHKLAGVIASVSIIVHFYLMYKYRGLSITGLIAAIFMWIVGILGIYGFSINKNMRGSWVKIHRILGLILILLVLIHVI